MMLCRPQSILTSTRLISLRSQSIRHLSLGTIPQTNNRKFFNRERVTVKRTMATDSSMTIVSTDKAPAAIGPYSQAIKAGNLVFASGCIPINPATGEVVSGGIEAQAKQALANLRAVLEASGSSTSKVVKTLVFMKDMNDFATINGIYAEFFGSHKPARSAVEVARLPKDVLFEIECVALL